MRETQRERRGHAFLPADPLLDRIPELYATDRTPVALKLIHLRFFCGPATWLVAELDRESLLAFGWANLGDERLAEWGYVSLVELEELIVPSPFGFTWIVERDVQWTPTLYGEI